MSASFVQRINVVTGTTEWWEEPDDYDYHQEVARSAYADMLLDHDRNMKYYKGLELTINELHRRGEKAVVLDIGTGTGLLSMMAAKLGAETIYACEAFEPMAKCAAKVIKHNGYTDRIKLITKRSSELEVGEGKDLETRANILVTEIFDTELIGEGAIGTYNHAHEFLLTEHPFLIPTKAVYYAQVVYCPMVASWNQLTPIQLPNGVAIKFPEEVAVCGGVPSVHDIQLSEIKEDQFIRLSDPIPIFEFDWAEHSKRLPSTDASSISFSAKASEQCTAVFTWWDLQMSSLEDSGLSSNTITMKPSWAGKDSVWRDHWMQAIYHNPKPIQMTAGINYTLQSFRDEYCFWFDVVNPQDLVPIDPENFPQCPICTCGVHIAISRSRLGIFNDPIRRQKYLDLFTPVVKKDTVCFVMSEGSSLAFILAGLGAQKVFVLERNGISNRVMKKLIEHVGFGDQIYLVDDLSHDSLKTTK